MKKYSFTFDPNKKGLRKILGDLETDIMEILWKQNEMTVHDVHKKILSQRSIAYTTVMTVMSRLEEKGLLRRVKEGNVFVYSPSIAKEQFTLSTVKKVINEILADFSTPALSSFVESLDEMDSDKIKELTKLIEEKRK